MTLYRSILRPLLFQLDAETAHHVGLWGLELADLAPALARQVRKRIRPDRPSLRCTVAGLHFDNPLGLAAGLDKDARAVAGLFSLGFGAIEVGTVTPRSQPGNPRPRLFRIVDQQAIINRFGFNNEGMQAMAARLRELEWKPGPIGVNIGKNKDTPLDAAVDDYVACAQTLAPCADYLTVNLSSPNTPGLRSLQNPHTVKHLLMAVRKVVPRQPLFLKIAPDMDDDAIDAVVDVAQEAGCTGLICTNTTLTRPFPHALAEQAGGLSGRPLMELSTHVVRRAFRRAPSFPIVGVGGISSGEDAWKKIGAGASLIQIYSAFIFQGPPLIHEILDTLERKVQEAGLTSIGQAVGRDA